MKPAAFEESKSPARGDSPFPEGESSERGRWRLSLALRLMGAVDSLALLAVVMPETWMGATHQMLGLGELPRAPTTGYLARSASALYALHGAMLLFLSFDVVRYRPLIAFLAWAAMAHGLALFAIDWLENMPWWWTLCEGPGFLAMGVLVLWLLQGVRRER